MSQPPSGPLMAQPMKGKPLDPPTAWERSKGKVYALALLAVIFAASALSAASYNHAFDDTVPITLKADRAGLQMQAGNRVKIRGVDLGRVDDVQLNEAQDGVDIVLEVEPDLLEVIPDNATVSLEQLTAFGNKAVQINYPANPSGRFLREGSVIAADHVSTEINSVFDELMTLLTRVQPAKLNAVLGGLANTLQGNGDLLGSTITEANSYLKKFNTDLPALERDFRSAAGFADVYAGAGDSISDLISNAGVVADTLGDTKGDFDRTLTDVGGVGDEVTVFFEENGEPLTKALRSIRPFTSLLDEYAPMLTCFVDGMAVVNDRMTQAFNENGAMFEVNFVQPGSSQMYHYPTDLPRVGPGKEKGPNCRGLPLVTDNEYNLADYTTDPPSLNQRTTDNQPRLALPGSNPFPSVPPLNANAKHNMQMFSSMTPLQRVFGPTAVAPLKTSAKKAGK